MPKVLRIINRFNLGGPTFNAAYLTRYLAPDFETLLIGGAKDPTEENSEFILQKLNLEARIINEMKRSINPFKDLIAYRKIKQIIKEFKPDIVHTHASKAGAIGRRAAYNMKVPVILHTFHGHVFDAYFSSVKSGLYQKIERNLAAKSNCIISLSDKQRDDLVNKYNICDESKIVVLPLGFDLSQFRKNMEEKRTLFRKEYNIQDDEIAIGIIGRIVPIKNHELFLKGIRHVMEHSAKKIRAFIIGDGESRAAVEEKARELKVPYVDYRYTKESAPLTFTSWLKNVDEVNAGMDIISLTSLNEGTPVSLIEAQAANNPIVCTNVGGIENIVIPGKTALLSDLHDDTAFERNLLSLVEDEGLREELSTGGWDFVREKYHYTRLVSDMKVLYERLLNGKSCCED